jgi:hypothetical protein
MDRKPHNFITNDKSYSIIENCHDQSWKVIVSMEIFKTPDQSYMYVFIDWFLFQENCDEQWEKAMQFLSATAELNYMTQIVIMMFEDPTKVRFKDVSSNPTQARCTRCNIM